MKSKEFSDKNLVSVIGYGTFITKFTWKDKPNVEVCLIRDFIRIFPIGYWFPFVLPLQGASFWALKFDVDQGELKQLDKYEGVFAGLYERVEIEAVLKKNITINAFLYIPTVKTIRTENLSPVIDPEDRWKEEIKNFPKIIKKFPELVL